MLLIFLTVDMFQPTENNEDEPISKQDKKKKGQKGKKQSFEDNDSEEGNYLLRTYYVPGPGFYQAWLLFL